MSLHKQKKSQKNNLNHRDDGTRQALIEAGLKLFGEYGFKSTSTRMLSQESGANVSAIPYYFGNKEGLYYAVVEHIVDRAASYVGPAYQAIRDNQSVTPTTFTKNNAKKALQKLVESLTAMFVDADEPENWALIIMREQAQPTHAFDIFYKSMMKDVYILMAELIAVCTGLKPDSNEAKIRTHALIGQILVFLSSREVILRQLGTKKLKPHHVKLIHSVLWAHIEAALKVPTLD